MSEEYKWLSVLPAISKYDKAIIKSLDDTIEFDILNNDHVKTKGCTVGNIISFVSYSGLMFVNFENGSGGFESYEVAGSRSIKRILKVFNVGCFAQINRYVIINKNKIMKITDNIITTVDDKYYMMPDKYFYQIKDIEEYYAKKNNAKAG